MFSFLELSKDMPTFLLSCFVGTFLASHVGLDRYQYSVSVSGRYQWYRFGIGIADTAADTSLLTIHWKQETDLHRRRCRRLKALYISIFPHKTEAVHPTTTTPNRPTPTVCHNGRHMGHLIR